MENKITKIELGKRNKERVNIYINDEYAFSCSSELVYYHSLTKGKIIKVEELEKIIEEDNYIKGKNKALKYLERSYKTEKQIEDYLIKKEYSPRVIARIMKFLIEYAFVNDNRYAKLYVESRIKREGKTKIRFDLTKKGIEESLIEEVLNNCEEKDEKSGAYNIALKKAKILFDKKEEDFKIKKKLYDLLMRKGYGNDIINSVINQIMDEFISLKKDDDNIREITEEEIENRFNELHSIAAKRYNILIKSEKNEMKLKKKLYDYLLRRGYTFEEIKEVYNSIKEHQ